jgi:hypothetical protein
MGQMNSFLVVAASAVHISWPLMHNTQTRMSCTSFRWQIKQTQLSLDFFGGCFFPFYCPAECLALFLWSQVYGYLMLKSFVFTATARLFNNNNFLAFVISFWGLAECFGRSLVVRSVNVLVFLVKVHWLHSSPDWYCLFCKRTFQYSLWLVNLCQMYQVQEKLPKPCSVTKQWNLASPFVSPCWGVVKR